MNNYFCFRIRCEEPPKEEKYVGILPHRQNVRDNPEKKNIACGYWLKGFYYYHLRQFEHLIGSVLGSAKGENSGLPVVTEGKEQGKININM